MRIRAVLTTLPLLAVLALSGCGSSSGDGGSSTKVLSKAELTSSLITLDDLGPGFEVDKSADDDDDADLGCLNGLDKLDKSKAQPARDKDISYQASKDPNLPGVFSTVGSFRSDAKAAKVLEELGTAIADCKTVDVTDKDGFRLKLRVSSNHDETDADATGQVNVEAAGTASGEGFEFPFAVRFSAIQVGNQVAVVGYVNAVKALGPDADAVVQRAFDRLAPVAAGKKAAKLPPLDLDVTSMEEILGGNASGQA